MMVFMPPQHGKSELTSRRLPAYMLGRNPNLRIALCAYNATFASKFNRQVQRIMSEKSYLDVFPDTPIYVCCAGGLSRSPAVAISICKLLIKSGLKEYESVLEDLYKSYMYHNIDIVKLIMSE